MPVFRNPPWTLTRTFDTRSAAEKDWWQDHIRADDARKRGMGKGVVICYIDTGADLEHSDLKANIVDAKDFTGSPFGPMDVNMHGSHVAGIGSAVENDAGVKGVAPLSKILVAKALGDDGSGYDNWIVVAIKWAVKKGANILSMSLGSQTPSPLIVKWVHWAIDQGVTVVLAVGNEGQVGVGDPGRNSKNGIRVAGFGRDGKIAKFSSRGPEVDVAAPGVDILSCIPGGKWARMSGTSMATPIVAGVCALIMSSTRKKLTPAEVKKRLLATVDDAGKPGHDNDFGFGVIRPDKAVFDDEDVSATTPAHKEFDFGIFKAVQLKKGEVAPHDGALIY